MITVDCGGRGLTVDYVIKFSFLHSREMPIRNSIFLLYKFHSDSNTIQEPTGLGFWLPDINIFSGLSLLHMSY